jgi:hypothetical protein
MMLTLFSWFWATFGITGIILVGITLIFIAIMLLRRAFIGIILDYLVDFGFSMGTQTFLNYPFSLVGGFLAAIPIFFKERHVSGNLIAGIVAWEATGFFPICIIPGIGPTILLITNIFPAVTISRLLFMKFSSAQKEEVRLEENLDLAADLGISKRDEETVIIGLHQDYAMENYTGAMREAKETNATLENRIIQKVHSLLGEVRTLKQQVEEKYGLNALHVTVSEEDPTQAYALLAIEDCEDLLDESQDALEKHNLGLAVSTARRAKERIIDLADQTTKA